MGKVKPGAVLAARIDPQMKAILDSNAEIVRSIQEMRKRVENSTPRDRSKDWCRIENATAEEAHVYIYDEIGFWGTTADGFVKELSAITSPKMVIHINSPGGEVFDGVAIHSALMANPAHITVMIDGLAASAASFIAMAGDRIVMARHATMMIHEASGLVWGNKRDMRKQADLLEKLDGNIADMYALQADGTAADWLARMENETWYTGPEALAAGLVDEITQPDDPDEDAAKNAAGPAYLSLAAFKYANRAAAPDPVIAEPEPKMIDSSESQPNEAEVSDWEWRMKMAISSRNRL